MNIGLYIFLETLSLRSYVDILLVLLKSDFVRHIYRYLKVHFSDYFFDISAIIRYTEVINNTYLIIKKNREEY
jgi:hypothetical protein